MYDIFFFLWKQFYCPVPVLRYHVQGPYLIGISCLLNPQRSVRNEYYYEIGMSQFFINMQTMNPFKRQHISGKVCQTLKRPSTNISLAFSKNNTERICCNQHRTQISQSVTSGKYVHDVINSKMFDIG
jgi:spore coat protein CotF